MRLRIRLKLAGKRIPVNYRSLIQGFIYQAIGNNEYSQSLHNVGQRLENRPFKLFVFSEIFGDTQYDSRNHTILFLSNANFEISSFDDELLYRLANFLEQNDFIVLGKEVIPLLGYEIIDDFIKQEEVLTFKTISPVIINKTENKRPIYLYPSTLEYHEMLINNILKKHCLCFDTPAKDFEIIEIANIKEKKVYFRNIFYISYNYEITFKNLTQELIQLIMRTGIGSKNSMGFGMLRYEKGNISL